MPRMSSDAGADEPATEIFTAVSILNREGHVPGAADRSVQPQHRRAADPGDEGAKRMVIRRGAIAGGAVLAAGAAAGVAVFAGSEPTAGETAPVDGTGAAEETYPGQGLLDAEVPAELPPEPVVIDAAAGAGPLGEVAPVVSPGVHAGATAGADPAVPEAAAAPASPDPGGPDPAPGGSGNDGGEDDVAFGSGSGPDASDGETSDGDTSGEDASDGDTGGGEPEGEDTGGGEEGALLRAGSDDGLLGTGLLASDSGSSDDGGDGGGEDDGGVLGTGLLG